MAAAAAIFMSWPAAAQQQSRCDARGALSAYLAGKYREATVAIALTDDGRLLEVLASPDGATWSIILTPPEGPACVVATGRDWRVKKPEDPGT